MRIAVATVALAAVSSNSVGAVEPVPEGIHSNMNGSPDICGLKGKSVADLESAVKKRRDVEILQGTVDYTAYAITRGGMRVLTFTTAHNRAHPAVACREIADAKGGGSSVQTTINCFNSRENCDWLYREFEELTGRTLRSAEVQQ